MTPKARYAERIREIIAANIDEEQKRIDAHDKIAAMLREKYDGKKLTKRIEGHARAALGLSDSPVVSFSTEHGSMTLRIWGKETPWPTYTECATFWLGSCVFSDDLRENYRPEEFEKSDACCGNAAKERNVKRRRLLMSGEKEIERLATALWMRDEAARELEACCEFETDLNVDRYAFEKIMPGTLTAKGAA